jgi:hypothetical protein
MILLRTGSVGEGKSACTITECLDHLRTGGVVATNFGLTDNWSKSAVRSSVLDFFDDKLKFKRQLSLWERWFRIGSVESINKLAESLPDLVVGSQKSRLKKHQRSGRPGIPEGLGMLVLDEGHMYFNSHDFKKNAPYRRLLSQSRKKGWDVVIIAHEIESIDGQIRRGLINQEENMRNLSNVQVIPMTPIKFGWFTFGRPVLLGIRKLSGKGGGSGMISKRMIKVLTKADGAVFNTMEEFDHEYLPDFYANVGCAPAPPDGARRVSYPVLHDAFVDIQKGLFSLPSFPVKEKIINLTVSDQI